MHDLQNKIQAICYAERARWILWLPVFVGVGIGIYFGLENEPSLLPLMLAVVAGVIFTWIAYKKQKIAVTIVLGIGLCILLGMALATWRTQSIAAPILHKTLYPQIITGVVAEITTRPDSTRLTLALPHIEDLSAAETPKYVTVSLRQHVDSSVGLGDTVRMRAGFFPPPMPGFPGGYAFNRYFFFKQIGAMGYALGKTQPEILQKAEDVSGFGGWVARQRQAIATWLMEKMGPREGSVAAALMVGEAKAIPEDIYEAMRQSGLVHVLSISGMHLTLAATIMFFSVRLLLACIPAFSLRYDGKKVAAVVALVGTFMYLLLAGSPISAQRSFVMVALVLGAVMLSRTVTPMRSLCLAAAIILVVTPESLLNPGFQLSFAATMAILAYYEHWMEKSDKIPPEEWSWQRKQRRFWGGIIATSAVATLATTPFVLYHFDGLPLYSIFANLLVTPLVSFWIMPLVVLVLALLPFGIAGFFLPLLKGGIYLMIQVAKWVFMLPYAVINLPPLSTIMLVVITLGGLWLCLWQTRWRYCGLVTIAIGCASLFFYQPPDMVISADGKKIAVRTAPEAVVMLHGQRSGFMQDGWLRFLRVEELHSQKQANGTALQCDDLGCIYHWNGKEIAFSHHRSTLAEDCLHSDMVVTPEWSSYHDTRGICGQAQLFDRSWLAKVQGAAFWITPDGIRYHTVRETLGNRPWSVR